jgi:hypothetical protein
MRGSLHCATDDETVRRFGRDDGRLIVSMCTVFYASVDTDV